MSVRLIKETPRASVITPPTAITGLMYNDNPQTLITAGSASNGTMQYKLGTGAWSTSLPQATYPGYYVVSYKVVGDAGYEDYIPANNTLIVYIGIDPAMPRTTIDSWSGTGMVVTTKTQNIGTTTATVYTNGTERATDLTLSSVDAGIWSIPAALNDYAGQNLLITFSDGTSTVSIIDTIVPYVVSTDATMSALTIPANADVQLISGTLTVDADATIAALDIYPDAKAVVETGNTLNVTGITMRADGINDAYPQLIANGHITNANNDSIYYDYALNYATYYPLAVPYDVSCSAIRTRSGKRASYEVQWYNGEDRAANAHAWTVLDDQAPGATLHSGQGHIVFAVPYKWNGTRQSTAVVRFPMHADLTAGEPQKTVPVSLYGNGNTSPSNRNWNFIGNPYLATYRHNDDTQLLTGTYDPSVSTPDIEQYTYTDDGIRYITTSNDGYQSYIQTRVQDIDLLAFHSYFVQAAASGDLVFALSQRAQHAPRRVVMENDERLTVNNEVSFGIILSGAAAEDRTGLLYGNAFTDAYELNADLVKMFGSAQGLSVYTLANNDARAFNALAMNDITHAVPLGFRNAPPGEYTFAFDSERYDASALEAVMLTDYETGMTVNLLEQDYRFTTTLMQNDTRFVIYAVLRSPQVTTDIDTITNDKSPITDGVYDILGRRVTRDVLPAGVYVIIENGQSRKEVIR